MRHAASGDAAARERIRTSLNESLLVEASAGTGKTSELVRRITAVLAAGLTRIGSVVAVTFTHKAAGELKLRLRQELDTQRAAETDAQRAANLEHALAHLEEAAIGTIHSFCAQILRERPVEARVDPDFEELDEGGARRLYEAVFRRWLQEKLNQDSPGLRRALARLAVPQERESDFTPIESLQYSGWSLIEWRDFPTPYHRPELAREQIIDTLTDRVWELSGKIRTKDQMIVGPLRDMMPWMERKPRDYDMLEGLLFRLHRQWKRKEKSIPDKALFQAIGDYRPVYDADLAAQLRSELWELVERYQTAKRRTGQLDFTDLLLIVRDLVRDQTGVRNYLQNKYTHLYVDEFQDTDPLQAEILLLLSANDADATGWLRLTPRPGKLFLVGDPKQSIYKFRRADVQLYQMLRSNLQQSGVALLTLSRSFRSVPGIQQCVNAAFAPEMRGDVESAQADYVPLEPHRESMGAQPAVVAIPAPAPYGTMRLSNVSIDLCLPAAITGFVEWLVRESGWVVGDPENPGEKRPVQPGDICLLFRRFTNYGRDVTRDYVRSLEDRGIPHLLAGSKTYFWREEIDTLRAALTAVEWPEDELSVFAALKGALFANSDGVLLRYRHEHRHLHPIQPLPEELHEDFIPVKEALLVLRELHEQRNRRPMAETVYRLLEASRAWAAFASRPAGNQALANVRRIIDLARQFESSGGLSFRGFVEDLNRQAERAESAEAPVLEEGADGVRLMTVHAAKGLEFPVVILADMTAALASAYPQRFVDAQARLCAMRLIGCDPLELHENRDLEARREQAEGVRVAYVAATRARDLLVVPVVGDAERPGWVSPLNKAIYPAEGAKRKSRPAPLCPQFGAVSVLERPPEIMDEISVRPGLQDAREGGHAVVWWDPAILPQGKEEQFEDRQREVFAEDEGALAEGMARHDAWARGRDELLRRGSAPALSVTLASQAMEAPVEWHGEIVVEQTARPSGRPAGARFGALIHTALRDCPLQATRAEVEAAVRLAARLVGAPMDEQEAAAVAVGNTLRHPILERARAARRLYREYPVLLHPVDGQVLEGVIDLAFEEDDRWVVVDFKSDTDAAQMLARYKVQIGWYSAALERIKGKPVQAVLLAV